ncbi:MAG: O-antigen ligase family protein [Bryobacterales bacterium]|nr:O-antigen ligase family protein [Bryobacterales bacterium]
MTLSIRISKSLGFTLLVAMAVAAGWVLTLGTYTRLVLAALALVALLLAVGVQAQNHVKGLFFLVLSAVLFPFQFGRVGAHPWNTSFFLACFICSVWLMDAVILGRLKPLEQSRLVVAVVALMGCTVVSFIAGQFPHFDADGAPRTAQAMQTAIFLVSAALLLAVGQLVGNLRTLEKLTWLFLGAGSLACVLHFAPTLGRFERLFHAESIGSMFWVWIVAVSLSQAAHNRRLHPLLRIALAGVTVLALYRGLFQARSWASGWLPPLAAAGIILFLRAPRLTVVSAVVVGLLLVNVLPVVSNAAYAEEEYSAVSRLEAWRVLWPIIMESPVLGLGPANYYYYAQLFPIMGWYVTFSSHNQYIDLMAQLGFLGLAVFLWFAAEAAVESVKLYVKSPAGFPKAYMAGVLGGLGASILAGGLADWIVPFYYNIGIRGFRSSLLFWVFLGGLLVVRRSLRAEAGMRRNAASRTEAAVPVYQA